MSGRVFLDTNVIIYLYSEDEKNKRDAVYRLVNDANCVASIQTMSEASNIWFKKYNLSKSEIARYLDEIEAVCDEIMLVRRRTLNQALDIKDRYKYSFYDSLILATALEGNCEILFSEDMQDGQIINGMLKIVNPFKEASK